MDDGEQADGFGLPIAKLWINGASVPVADAHLRVGGTQWRVEAALHDHDPFRQRFGLSMQLRDGRVVHGEARLVDAMDGAVTFEGTERLGGAWLAS